MKKKRNILLSFILSMFLACGVFVGCGDKGTIELYQKDNIYEVELGNSLQLSATCEGVNEDDIEYTASAGAVITNTGLLTINEDTAVNTIINVVAKVDDVESNTLKITVVDLEPESIELNASSNIIAKGGSVDLSVDFEPDYATLTQYDLAIIQGSTFASLNGNQLIVSANAEAEIGSEIKVQATLRSNTNIKDTISIYLVETVDIASFTVDNVEIVTSSTTTKFINITAYDSDYETIDDIDLNNFVYTSSNEDVVTVGKDGKLTAKGHGEATIGVRRLNSQTVEKTCNVYVMVPPTALNLTNVSTKIVNDKIMSYSRVDKLNLGVSATNVGFDVCSQKLVYTFEKLDENNDPVATGDDVAVYDEATGIDFKTIGKVRVTITSNSKLNNSNASIAEASITVIVNVNEGINIDTVTEFVAYAKQTQNKVANITKDLYLTATENFGFRMEGGLANEKIYGTLQFVGDREINGNGYVISTERLPLLMADGDTNEGEKMFNFTYQTLGVPFEVVINDLEIVGCGGVNGVYTGQLAEDQNKAVVSQNGDFVRTYRLGLAVYGEEYFNETEYPAGYNFAYAKDLVLNNVKVSGFDVGYRLRHCVDATLTNVAVDKCFSNGFEFDQCTVTLHNLKIGKVGAFGIEMVPDNMADRKTNNPKGTAGANYDSSPVLKLTGSIDSDNYTNGADTPYMQGLTASLGASIPTVLEMICEGMVQSIVPGDDGNETVKNARLALTQTLFECLKRESDGNMNFYLLIFVNKAEGMVYDDGNTENVFAQYQHEGSDENMINVLELLMEMATDPDYEDYKKYQYIQMDLTTGALMGNIGQVILVNSAYDPNYVPAGE